MEHLDPVQRHNRIEPLFSYHNREYASKDSDDETTDFENYLEEAIEDSDSLPEDLERLLKELKLLRVHSEEEVFIMAMNFNQHGLQLMNDINMTISLHSYERELAENELLKVINALFILTVQYGVAIALQSLSDIWQGMGSDSKLNLRLRNHFIFIAKSTLPLVPYKQMLITLGGMPATEKEKSIKLFLKDILIHRFIDEKAKPILEAFTE
jgi:hypothetical protein